ncbi:MAG: hypothetical protein KC421_21110, partial [Anaerolineales bacterium]|nr:hypothetical protein [Anaerolineales bacterium]
MEAVGDATALPAGYNLEAIGIIRRQTVDKEKAVTDMKTSIRVGSIIHLESVDSDGGEGGFLNMLGWVTDIPV